MPQGERSVPLGGVPRGGPPLGDSLVTFSSGRKSPGCRAERLHWGPQGLPAPHKLPGRGAERPPRNKHTPGTARQAVGARTKPMRESGAASCRRESGAGSACRREGKAKIKKEPGRESGAASCRRELRPGSAWWWRRGELNPCPKTSPYVFLRAQFTVFALRQLPFAAHRQTGAPHR